MWYKISSTIIIGLLSFSLFAQKILILEKEGRVKRTRIYEGKEIFLKVKNRPDEVIAGKITQMDSTSFVLNDMMTISIDNIVAVRKQSAKGWDILKFVSGKAGKLFFGVSTFNRITNGDAPVVHPTAAIILGASEALFFLSHRMSNKWFVVGRKKRIRIINITPV